MVRKSGDNRFNSQANIPLDVVSTNSTAAHFIRAAQPTWMYANPQSVPIQPRRPYSQDTAPLQTQSAASSRPEPTKIPITHKSGTVRNADGLPSPAPSHESNRETPETSIALDNMARNHGLPIVNKRQTSVARPASAESTSFQVPAAPPTVTVPFQEGTSDPLEERRLAGVAPSGPATSYAPNAAILRSNAPSRRSSNAAAPVSMTQSIQFPPPPAKHMHYLNNGGYSAQMKAYYDSRVGPSGLDARLNVLRFLQIRALDAKPVDTFFLVLLQLVCVNNTAAQNPIPLPWRSIIGIQGSLSLMATIIASYGFTEDFCRYFAKVPLPIQEISNLSPTVNHFVGRALHDFPGKYNYAYTTVLARGYPLLPDEFYYDLHIISPIVQKLFNDHFLFACFRFNDEGSISAMQILFSQIQDSFFAQRLPLQQPGLAQSVRPLYEQQTRPLCERSLQLFRAYSAQASSTPVQHGLGLQGLPPGMSLVDTTQSQSRRPRRNPSHSQTPMSLNSGAANMSNAGFGSSLPSAPMAAGMPAMGTMTSTPATFVLQSMTPQSQAFAASQTQQQHAHIDPGTLRFWNRGDGITQSAVSNPEVYAMHQLHLLDKHMKVDKTSLHPGPFFQIVGTPPLPLQPFSTDRCSYNFKFHLSELHLPQDCQVSAIQPAEYPVKSDTQILRFRCVKQETGGATPSKHPLDRQTYWPKNIIFTCNGKALEPRRKVQWHKDLPVDLTSFLKFGENEVKVLINRLKHQEIEQYAVTVERTMLAATEMLTWQVRKKIMPGAEFVKSLFQKASNGSDDDDDMVVVTATREVPIIDPIVNGGICRLFVRGENCIHPQAFELESFLQSRLKPAGSDVYNLDWSCPICKLYAGPDVLYVEEYFMKVRAVLEKRAEQDGDESMETRSIIISTDGSWTPKKEELEGESGDGGMIEGTRAASKPPRMNQVIELD